MHVEDKFIRLIINAHQRDMVIETKKRKFLIADTVGCDSLMPILFAAVSKLIKALWALGVMLTWLNFT